MISVYSEMVNKTSYRMSTVNNAPDHIVLMFIDSRVEWLKKFLYSEIPWYHYQSLVDRVTTWLTKAVHMSKAVVRRSNSPPESLHHVHVLVRFINLLISGRVSVMDLASMPKVLKDCVYRHLDKLTGLERLSLGSGNGENIRQQSFLSLRMLTQLTHLTLQSDCQNESLAIIGQNCSRLSQLDISSSGSVTEQGTPWLLLCRSLQSINLFQTSQSVSGYAQLLQGLPRLTSVGRCDMFGEIMEYIARLRSQPPHLQISHLHTRDMTHKQLQLTVSFCPNIEHVNLYVDEDLLLSPLSRLQRLHELKLLACNFYSDRVDRLIVEKGPGLTLLHLEHIDELDMEALKLIAQSCPNLVKLVFFSCDFVEHFGTNLAAEVPVSSLLKLQSLVCVSECTPTVIEFLLTHAKFVTSVQFGSTAWFNDDIVSSILVRGGLKQLTEMVILRSYELSMSAVESLLRSCPRLTMLGELDGWEGVSSLEISALRAKIKKYNWDLDIDCTWSAQ